MKNVLEFSEDELRSLSEDELKILLQQAENGEVLYNTKQTVAKLSLNSLYGALANTYFPLFNQDIARAITGNGRYFIALLAATINKRLNEYAGTQDVVYTIAGDTDSCYFSLKNIIDQTPDLKDKNVYEITDWIDIFSNDKIQTIIKETIELFSKRLNAFEPEAIGADREAISSKSIFAAKKKYMMRLLDNEGVRYNPPKLKIVGLDIARSSTPAFIKKKLKDESIDLILDGNMEQIQDWLTKTKEEFFKQPLENISKASGVTSIDYKLGIDGSIPINSRASLVYNKFILDNNLEDSYQLIEAEDNMRMLYLALPNPFNSNIVAFKDVSFIENFREYVDFDTNFEKFFKAPLEFMSKPAGFDLDKTTAALDDW